MTCAFSVEYIVIMSDLEPFEILRKLNDYFLR
jgi:hypothetical protein